MIRTDLTNEQYHAHHAISSSDVKAVLTSSIWHWKNKVNRETAAMQRGTAVHDFALEGGANTMRGPETRRGNAWKDALDEAGDKMLLPEKEYDEAYDIAQALLADKTCAKQLTCSDAKKEHSIFATCPHTGLELRCRPDLYNPTDMVMSDVKTTTDASPTGFLREVYKYRYDVQAATYKYISEIAGWKVTHFAFLAVETSAPYAAHMHVMSQEAMEIGRRDMMLSLQKIAEAKAKDDYSLDWGRFTMVHPPSWVTAE